MVTRTNLAFKICFYWNSTNIVIIYETLLWSIKHNRLLLNFIFFLSLEKRFSIKISRDRSSHSTYVVVAINLLTKTLSTILFIFFFFVSLSYYYYFSYIQRGTRIYIYTIIIISKRRSKRTYFAMLLRNNVFFFVFIFFFFFFCTYVYFLTK